MSKVWRGIKIALLGIVGVFVLLLVIGLTLGQEEPVEDVASLAPSGAVTLNDTNPTPTMPTPPTEAPEPVVKEAVGEPTVEPTEQPTAEPTEEPTAAPTAKPVAEPVTSLEVKLAVTAQMLGAKGEPTGTDDRTGLAETQFTTDDGDGLFVLGDFEGARFFWLDAGAAIRASDETAISRFGRLSGVAFQGVLDGDSDKAVKVQQACLEKTVLPRLIKRQDAMCADIPVSGTGLTFTMIYDSEEDWLAVELIP